MSDQLAITQRLKRADERMAALTNFDPRQRDLPALTLTEIRETQAAIQEARKALVEENDLVTRALEWFAHERHVDRSIEFGRDKETEALFRSCERLWNLRAQKEKARG